MYKSSRVKCITFKTNWNIIFGIFLLLRRYSTNFAQFSHEITSGKCAKIKLDMATSTLAMVSIIWKNAYCAFVANEQQATWKWLAVCVCASNVKLTHINPCWYEHIMKMSDVFIFQLFVSFLVKYEDERRYDAWCTGHCCVMGHNPCCEPFERRGVRIGAYFICRSLVAKFFETEPRASSSEDVRKDTWYSQLANTSTNSDVH